MKPDMMATQAMEMDEVAIKCGDESTNIVIYQMGWPKRTHSEFWIPISKAFVGYYERIARLESEFRYFWGFTGFHWSPEDPNMLFM